MDYLKTAVPSQLINERGSNLVVINPGSANLRIGLGNQQVPLNIPHYIARHVNLQSEGSKRALKDQMLNLQATPDQQVERMKAYNKILSQLKIPSLGEEIESSSYPRKMGRVDGYTPHQNRDKTFFTWTNVKQHKPSSSVAVDDSQDTYSEKSEHEDAEENKTGAEATYGKEPCSEEYKEIICGEEALKISPAEPYILSRPIRRGHFNISQHYSTQQVIEDLFTIWDWALTEKLHIPIADRSMYSAIIVVPETFDNREIKEVLSIVLRDLRFSMAVVHQEGLAAAFGNGLSTACIVNIGAQVTSIICVEDGVALPTTVMTLLYGGEDISRCFLWVQRQHQTWPPIQTNPLAKPIDMLMLNNLKEMYSQFTEGEFDAVAIIHTYDKGSTSSHKARLSALNIPPMGLFFPALLLPEEYPEPPRTWFLDYEDMLVEDAWHMDMSRRPDMSDGVYLSSSFGQNMWDNYPILPTQPKKDIKIGLAEAVTRSILSTGRLDLQRKLFCSIQLIGGVALTKGLVAAVEERVLQSIPSNEAIDTVEVLQSRSDPSYVAWKGGAILGILDFARDAWIYREDWIRNGIHIAGGRKYKDSYFVQAQAMCYINS